MKKELNLALCKGRHEILQATDGAIFPEVIPEKVMLNQEVLEEWAWNGVWNAAYAKNFCTTDENFWDAEEWGGGVRLAVSSDTHVHVYVTGLTVALIAVLNVCRRHNLSVTCWHYNRETAEYFPQEIEP